MFLYLGDHKSVFLKDIVAIIDMDAAKFKITKEFLNNHENIIYLYNKDAGEKPKSMIIVNDKTNYLYVSSVSTQTLKKRIVI